MFSNTWRQLSQCSRKCCGPHGRHFKQWASKATRAYPNLEPYVVFAFPDKHDHFHAHYCLFDLWIVRVTRCHSYVVHKKWKYECTFCKRVIRRHSKSIKLEVRLCGIFSMLFLQKGTEATIWLVESCSYKDAVVAAISCGSSAPSSATALQ